MLSTRTEISNYKETPINISMDEFFMKLTTGTRCSKIIILIAFKSCNTDFERICSGQDNQNSILTGNKGSIKAMYEVFFRITIILTEMRCFDESLIIEYL